MATTIVTKNSSTASAVPTAAQLVQGELAVNVADKRLYTEDNAGAIVELGTNPSTIDINSGTIDGTTIGASSASTGAFTTLTASGEITANGGIALGDNDKATFGASDDLQIYHNGSNSIITETGTGNLYLGGDNLLLTNGSLSAAYLEAITGGAVNIYHNGSTKLATTATGIDVTGSVTADGLTVSGSVAAGAVLATISNSGANGAAQLYLNNDAQNWIVNTRVDDAFSVFNATSSKTPFLINTNGDISFYEDTGTTAKLTWSAAGEDLNFADNVKATFGAGDDLQIYHDGADSYINDSGVGDLKVGGNQIQLNNAAQTKNYIYAVDGAQVELKYNNALKLATTATGIDVTGTATMDGLTVNGAGDGVKATIGKTGGTNLNIYADTNTVYLAGSPALSTAYIIDQTNNNMQFKVNAAERMRIDSSGNVNLTTANDTAGTSKFLTFGTNSFNRAGIKCTNAATYDGSLEFYTGNASNFAERMRIDSSGNLLVGTTSVISLGKQCIEFDGYSKNGLILKTTNTSMGSAYLGFVNSSGAIIGSINQLSTSTVAYNTSSDQRLKDNIADADDAGSKIDAIQVRQYDWKADGSHQDYGMIAQELQLVAPEAVSGDADSEEMMGVDYSKLVPMLIKEIQSLRNRVAQLEA